MRKNDLYLEVPEMLIYNQNKQFLMLFRIHCWFYFLGVCSETSRLRSQKLNWDSFHEKSPFIQRHVACNSRQIMYFLTGFVTNTCCDHFDKILLLSEFGFHKEYHSQHCLLAILENFQNAAGDPSYIPLKYSKKRPGRVPGIARNAGNHGNDEKFHESHKILNQI